MQRIMTASYSEATKEAARKNDLFAVCQVFKYLIDSSIKTCWRWLPFVDMPIRRPFYFAKKLILLSLDPENIKKMPPVMALRI